MNNDTASFEITVNVHESMLSRKLVFWMSTEAETRKADEAAAAETTNHVEENTANTSSKDVVSATRKHDGLTNSRRLLL